MPAITIAAFEREIRSHHAGKDHAPSTLRQVDFLLRELRAAGVRRTSDIRTSTITEIKRRNPRWSPASLRSYLRALRAMCRRAKKSGWLRVDPFDLDPIPTWVRDDARAAPAKRHWSLGPAEIRRVLELADREAESGDWCARRLRAYVWALLMLGMRPGELQRLEVWDVDLARRVVTIRAKDVPVQGKGERWWRPKTVGSAATIPIGDRLAGVLAEWIPQTGCRWLFPGTKRRGPWTSGGPGVRPLDQVKDLGKRAGVPGLWQKTGRKSVGTNARSAGVSKSDRRDLFRHSDESTGDLYDEGDVEGLRPAVAKIENYYLSTGS